MISLEATLKVVLSIGVDSTSATNLSRSTNISFAHLLKVLKTLVDGGYIASEKRGRERVLTLTESGLKLRSAFAEIDNMFKQVPETVSMVKPESIEFAPQNHI